MNLSSIVFTKNNSRTIDEDTINIDDLASSIKKNGLIAPIVLKEVPGSDQYEVIAGQRRYLALRKLRREDGSLKEGEYVIRDIADPKELDLLEVSIIENQHREALSPMDLNRSALKLNQIGSYKDKEIAKILNITPHRLKRIFKLGEDKNKMTPEIREELKKSGEEAVFTDAHWDKMRDIEDLDTMKDVFDQIMDKQLPPKDIHGIVNAVNKAKDAYDAEGGKGVDKSLSSPEEEEDTVSPLRYKHKGELQMDEEGGKRIFRVIGKGEDGEIPLDHYLEYLSRNDKFKCKIDLKLTFIPIDS